VSIVDFIGVFRATWHRATLGSIGVQVVRRSSSGKKPLSTTLQPETHPNAGGTGVQSQCQPVSFIAGQCLPAARKPMITLISLRIHAS
jgi:hypothetical protein